MQRLNISYRILGAAASRRPSLAVRELAMYIRAIVNPSDGPGLFRAISFPLVVPHRGLPSIGDRTRAKILELASSSNITVAQALSKIERAELASQGLTKIRIVSSIEFEAANQSSASSNVSHGASEVVLTARQAGAIGAAVRLYNELRTAAEAGKSAPALISDVIDRAGFRNRCDFCLFVVLDLKSFTKEY